MKNEPRLKLSDLLRRRKSSLAQFVGEQAITTYDGLVIKCSRLGVAPPTEHEAKLVFPTIAVTNSPQDGVIVVEPTPETETAEESPLEEVQADLPKERKQRKKKASEPVF
jgi:hypothetical protein